jgi:NAD(P)-dependent dehydrogenase (short-subunit alcohol dehydrogenase family)
MTVALSIKFHREKNKDKRPAMQFTGKTAIVTGGGGQIGRAIAQELAGLGCAVLITDRDFAALQASKRAIEPTPRILTANLANEEDIAELLRTGTHMLGRLDILVNCAGLGLAQPFLETEANDLRELLEVNLVAPFQLSQAAARRMIAQGDGGRIINIASIAGLRGSARRSAYGASKAALINLTQVMAVELADSGITVNAVAPGPIASTLSRGMHDEATRKAFLEAMPVSRYGAPEEIAPAVAYLASEAAAWTTGQVIAVDGGFAAAGLRL